MENLGINLGYIIVQIANFVLVLLILRAWMYKPLMNMLDKRRKTIAQGVEDARVAAEARANAEKEAEKIIADARAEASKLVREATERAETATLDVKAAAEAEIVKTREATLVDIEVERDRILSDIRGQVAALAIAAAQKLVGETVDDKRQHALLAEFFSGVKSGKVVVLEGEKVSGAAAEVVSALPLTNTEQSTIKKDVLAKMGSAATVTFRVDPAILGGLVIRIGDKVLDGSIAGKLESLRQTLH